MAREVESFARMWLDPKDRGGIELPFYPDPEMAIRKLGHGEKGMLASIFSVNTTYDPSRKLIPTRLSTPLSVIEAAYILDEYIGFYEEDTIHFLRDNIRLIPAAVLYIKAIPKHKRMHYELTFASYPTMYNLLSGNDVTGSDADSIVVNSPDDLVTITESMSSKYMIFPIIRIERAYKPIPILNNEKWVLEDDMYVYRD